MFEAFECNNLNLIAKLFGVVSPHGFDMGNIGLYQSVKKQTCTVKYDETAIAAEIDSKEKARISIWTGRKPNLITLNADKSRFSYEKV